MDVFDLLARIRLDDSEYKKKIGEAKGTMSTLASGVGKGLATVAKAGAAAVSAGVAGVAALTKMGVDGYAQYEQLIGGVETLFKESGNAVKAYAENAYKTSGLSANAYMETVTSFSASLIQSLDGDTAKAAKVADMAITDMSDNANKMGTSIEMLQHSYSGFAKQNFTMLDNLKLGYGGTKTEMERLLKDAEALSGVKYDISSYADIVEAIHVVQTEMGITGTTAKEAATTIQGSLSMMKGAWQNLVVGMADENANMDVLINNFVESTAIAAQNLIPRIEQTLQGIGMLIEKMAPIISEALPVLVESLLPTIITAGISLITALANAIVEALPAIKTALEEGLVIILTDVFGVSEDRARGFVDGLNDAFTKIADFFHKMVESAQTDGTWLNEIWTGLQEAAKAFGEMLSALFDVVSAAFKWCVEQVQTEGSIMNSVWEGIQTVISAAVEIINGVITAFTQVLQGDWEAAWDTVVETVENIGTELYEAGVKILNSLWDGLKSAWENVKAWWDGLTFGDKTANVNVNKNGGKGGKFATGLNYVPYDEFPAILHRGEAVLTAAEARVWRKGGIGTPAMAGGVTINQYIQSVPQTPADLASATEAYFEQARWML
jgi:phage-related protein